MSTPLIAIVGRPNVGKSTFFNRVLSQRQAIVDAIEGITRDRIYGESEWCGNRLRFIDTGGFIPEATDVFNAAVREQAHKAIEEADLLLMSHSSILSLSAEHPKLAIELIKCLGVAIHNRSVTFQHKVRGNILREGKTVEGGVAKLVRYIGKVSQLSLIHI